MKITNKKPVPLKAKKKVSLKAKTTVSLKAKKNTSFKTNKKSTAHFLALKKTDDKKFRKNTLKKRQEFENDENSEKRGIIVLSNLPHGFFEEEIKSYFRQFGSLKNVKLVRSKKTGRSCGYAYIEFEHYEVAQIVAGQMDGYLTFGKIMKCKIVPPEMITMNLFADKNTRPANCPKVSMRKGAVNKLNKKRTEVEIAKRKFRLTATYNKRMKALKELNIVIPTDALLDNEQQIKSDLQSASKPKTPKKSGNKSDSVKENMVMEVDESEDEITLKTPPNAVKKYIKSGSKSSPGTPSTKRKVKTPKSGRDTPKTKKLTPKLAAKATPKTSQLTPKAGKLESKMTKLTSKSGKDTPKLVKKKLKGDDALTPVLTNGTLKAGKVTPKLSKKTPKGGKLASTNLPESVEGMNGATSQSGKETVKTEMNIPGLVDVTPEVVSKATKQTPKGKQKTPKALKAIKETGGEGNSTLKKTPPNVAGKLTSKAVKGTPKAVTDTNANGELTESQEAETPLWVCKIKKTPKASRATPGSEDATPRIKKKKSQKTLATPEGTPKTPTSVRKTPNKQAHINGTEGKLKTPKTKTMDVKENRELLMENMIPLVSSPASKNFPKN